MANKRKCVARRCIFSSIMIVAFAVLLSLPGPTGAADYPTKPVQMVVGFLPGGPADLSARIICEIVSKGLNVPVVVVNEPGAEATIAATLVARSKPDG